MRIRHLTIVAAVALLAACGTTGTDTPKASPTSAAASYASFADYQLAFAKCMRGKGLDVPDPGSDGSQQLSNGGDQNAFLAASKACRDQLGTPPAKSGTSTMTDAQRQAANLKKAQCLRQHGVDVPDPKAGAALAIPDNAAPDALQACGANGGAAAPVSK